MSHIKLSDESHISVCGKDCLGCQSTDTELMLSFDERVQLLNGNNKKIEEVQFVDIFMSVDQALKIKEAIEEKLCFK